MSCLLVTKSCRGGLRGAFDEEHERWREDHREHIRCIAHRHSKPSYSALRARHRSHTAYTSRRASSSKTAAGLDSLTFLLLLLVVLSLFLVVEVVAALSLVVVVVAAVVVVVVVVLLLVSLLQPASTALPVWQKRQSNIVSSFGLGLGAPSHIM